jgi:hypothetical protein
LWNYLLERGDIIEGETREANTNEESISADRSEGEVKKGDRNVLGGEEYDDG